MTDGILNPETVGQLSLLRAMAVDPAGLSATIQQILEAQQAAEAALAELRKQETINFEILAAADQKVAEAATMAANAEVKSRELGARERDMAEVSEALNAEKAAFEAVRASVGADQKAKQWQIDEWLNRLAVRSVEVDKAAAEHADAIARANRLASTYEAKHKRLHEALMANEADEC